MNRKELASKLKIHPETLSKRLKEVGIDGKSLLSPNQVMAILDSIANPFYFRVTRLKLAKCYQVHPETMSKRLEEIGLPKGRRLTIEDLNKCYACFGIPIALQKLYPNEAEKLREQIEKDFSLHRKNLG